MSVIPAGATIDCSGGRSDVALREGFLGFRLAVSALVESILHERCCQNGAVTCEGGPQATDPAEAVRQVVEFVLKQHARMPDYLRLPLTVLTVVFDAWSIPFSGRLFHRLPRERRWRQVSAWRRSRLGFRRDLVRFYETLAVFGWYAAAYESLDR